MQGGFSYRTAGIRLLTRSRGVCSEGYWRGRLTDRPAKELKQATWRAAGGGWILARAASQPGFRQSRRRGPALPATDRPRAPVLTSCLASCQEPGERASQRILVGLEAGAAADDLLHDLGGAAEARLGGG